MALYTAVDEQTILEIRDTAKECLDRGLIISSKWLSELLLSIPSDKKKGRSTAHPMSYFSTWTPARSQSPQNPASFTDRSPVATQILTQTTHSEGMQPMEMELEKEDEDSFLAARSFYETREFQRAIHVLRECRSSKATFLRLYCRFIATEKKAQRDWHKLDSDRHQPPTPINLFLGELYDLVKDSRDPWLLFLKGLFLSRLARREEAIESVLLSLAGCKWNWSAWTLLGSCLGDEEELSSILHLIPLPLDHPLVQMFQIKIMNDAQSAAENELQLCDRLLGPDFFPNSLWVMGQRACALYHLHDFPAALIEYEKVYAIEPLRMDDVDIYSNILFVNECRLKLSKLAHDFLALDKDRPEVCCILGNHFSLRAEHEKSIKYFRRATQLDRTNLSAWILLGHEYLEMKNSHAAIEAYRRAVDVSRKDYRAWYGLGQAYELLSMHHYSLHYYQRATALRPYDVRLWQAQGMCYEEIGRLREAVECYKRALITTNPHEVKINLMLAKIHRTLDEHSEAVAYHRRVVDICQADSRPVEDYAKSCLEVSEYEMRIPNGDLILARDYLELVAGSNAEDVGKAAEMLKNLKTMIEKRNSLSHEDVHRKAGDALAQ